MNKKLVLGIFVAFSAGAFWACGSGDVVESDDNLEGLAVALLDQIGDVEVAKAVSTCAEDPQCAAEMGNAPSLAVQSSSSSEKPKSSSSTPTSSPTMSSTGLNLSFGPIGQKSSSSYTPPPSSPVVESSSSVVVPAGQYGYCTPSAKTAELNQAVTWTFNWEAKTSGVSTTDILAATYTWDLTGGTPATGTAKAAGTTYATSGPKTASVTVTTPAHGAQTIACAEGINVNGSPITGCKCEPTNIEPDVSKGEVATWTASGCSTGAGFTLAYAWTGATPDASGLIATAPVAVKGDEVTGVVLTVANDDNTIVNIPCDDAKAKDATKPDYEFIIADAYPEKPITIGEPGCITVHGTWTNEYYKPTPKIQCEGKITITYGTKTWSNMNNNDGSVTTDPLKEFVVAKEETVFIENICVDGAGATCKLSN